MLFYREQFPTVSQDVTLFGSFSSLHHVHSHKHHETRQLERFTFLFAGSDGGFELDADSVFTV